MKGSALSIIIITLAILAVIGMLGFVFLNKVNHSSISTQSSESNANASASLMPTIAVKDFAPGVPMSQKTTILIQTSDSSDVKYIVPTSQVSTYVKSLPEGYHVVSQTP